LLLQKAVHAACNVVLFVPRVRFLGASGNLSLVALAEVVGCVGGGLSVGEGDGGGVFVEGLRGFDGCLLLSEGGALAWGGWRGGERS
jgi:hypothetical protein